MKGAVDGGLHIPHDTRRFPGSTSEMKRKKVKYDASAHLMRLVGFHV